MVYAEPTISHAEGHINSSGILASPNLSQKTRLYNNPIKTKKKNCKIVDFAVPADHRMKLKENEKKELTKIVELERDNYTNCDWCSRYSH